MLSTADAIFARCLRDAGHLLWITDPSLPDIAVRNNDNEAAEELLEKNQLTMEVTFCSLSVANLVHGFKFTTDRRP